MNIGDLSKFGRCSTARVSPDGRWVAMISEDLGRRALWRVSTDGGHRERLSSSAETVEDFCWSPDSQYIAATLTEDDRLEYSVHFFHGRVRSQAVSFGSSRPLLSFWKDPFGIFLSAAMSIDSVRMDAYRLNPRDQSLEQVLFAGRFVTSRVVDVDDRGNLLIVAENETSGSTLLYHENGTQTTFRVFPSSKDVVTVDARFVSDASSVAVLSDYGRNYLGLGLIDVRKIRERERSVSWLTGDDFDVEYFSYCLRTSEILFSINQGGLSSVQIVSLRTLGVEQVDVPGDVSLGGELYSDGTAIIVNMGGAVVPSDVWHVNRVTGVTTKLSRSSRGGTRRNQLVTPERLIVEVEDGEAIDAWLYRSRNWSDHRKLVVSFHGGPRSQERPLFNSTYQSLLSFGIDVLAPNVRGSSGFGKRFASLDDGHSRVNAIADAKAVIDHVLGAASPSVDAVGVLGSSYGAFLASACLVEMPDRIAAGVMISGLFDLRRYVVGQRSARAVLARGEYGDPILDESFLESISPASSASRIQAPVLLFHGRLDDNVPMEQSELLFEALNKSDLTRHEIVLFDDEAHGVHRHTNRNLLNTKTVDWFIRHLVK